MSDRNTGKKPPYWYDTNSVFLKKCRTPRHVHVFISMSIFYAKKLAIMSERNDASNVSELLIIFYAILFRFIKFLL